MEPTFTKAGVCYPIEASPYTVDRHGLKFYFSSLSHKQKFERDVGVKESWVSDSLSRRFKCRVDAGVLAAIQFYTQVENRGDCIEDSDGVKWQSGGLRIKSACCATRSEPTTELLIG